MLVAWTIAKAATSIAGGTVTLDGRGDDEKRVIPTGEHKLAHILSARVRVAAGHGRPSNNLSDRRVRIGRCLVE